MVLFGSFNYSLNHQSISTPLMATYVTVPYSMIPLPKKNIVLNIALALTCLILLPRSDVPLQITPQPYVVPHQLSGPSWGKKRTGSKQPAMTNQPNQILNLLLHGSGYHHVPQCQEKVIYHI
eukprot:TRINITY_DN34236_c2_g1_i2.p1 TRINITY_DN34236_c2_g1~~TRINITY_DN34236_c2_g1_i2.p1  ORF type:complete len:122 (-),score=9.08 TRINITY_DN34236_c2_g1_i2:838-1203(-)